MHCLNELGFKDIYYLDGERIFNTSTNKYVNECGEYQYRLYTSDNKRKRITIKEIYKRLFNQVFCIDEIESLDGEEFREIQGTNGLYFCSNYSRIKSYQGNHAILLTKYKSSNGYEQVSLHVNGIKQTKYVHTIVCSCFLEPPKNLEYEIHHINLKRDSNSLSNLMYVSRYEHRKLHKKERTNATTPTPEHIQISITQRENQ